MYNHKLTKLIQTQTTGGNNNIMDKAFVGGKATQKTFPDGGSIINISVPVEELKKIVSNGWVNISICKMREAKNGQTHYMVNNAFAPKPTQEPTEQEAVDNGADPRDVS